MLESLLAKLDEVLCPNNRILGLMKRIQQALSPRGVTSTTSDDLGEVIRSVNSDDILEKWDEVLLQLKRINLHLFLISGFDGIEVDPGLVIKPKRHRTTGTGAIEDEDLADTLHFRDEKSDGTQSANAVLTTWNVREINTTAFNDISGASLSANQITLPAGTFDIDARGHAINVAVHRLRFRNVTDGSTAVVGASSWTDGTQGESGATLLGRFTIASSKTFEVQHWTGTSQSNGFGFASADTDEVEVYLDVWIKKIL